MKALLCDRWLRIVLCLAVSAAAVLVLVCWRYRVWSRKDFLDYMTVRHYAIGPDLWFGRITAGQDEKDLIARHPPHRVRQVGPFTHLSYYFGGPPPPKSMPFESLCVVVKGGKVVGAGGAGCTWQRVFIPLNAEDIPRPHPTSSESGGSRPAVAYHIHRGAA
jgi:hypothetical protein